MRHGFATLATTMLAVLIAAPHVLAAQQPASYSFRVEPNPDRRLSLIAGEGCGWTKMSLGCLKQPCYFAVGQNQSSARGGEPDAEERLKDMDLLVRDVPGSATRDYTCRVRRCVVTVTPGEGPARETTLLNGESAEIDQAASATVLIERDASDAANPSELDRLEGAAREVSVRFENRSLSSILGALGAAGSFKVTLAPGFADMQLTVDLEQTIGQALRMLSRAGDISYKVAGPGELVVTSRKSRVSS
jgi:hypothetical protein